MDKFFLNCGRLNSGVTSLEYLVRRIEHLKDNIDGYDLQNPDSFDFDSARKKIVTNVTVSTNHIRNTKILFQSVLERHSSVQQLEPPFDYQPRYGRTPDSFTYNSLPTDILPNYFLNK